MAATDYSAPFTPGRAVVRKTRIVCISDTHNQTPSLPRGDVLIHAGDLTNQGSLSELRKTISWLEAADFEAKIVVAGNHDITLDEGFYSEHGRYFHNQHPQSSADCMALVREAQSITYLRHEAAHVKLKSETGPGTHFRVFGSPFSPAHGLWAFAYKPDEAAALWDAIPLDTDVLITHTPPKGHCDVSAAKTAAGCEHLQRALSRVRPKLHICGHKHEGRGVERVTWDLSMSHVSCLEAGVKLWDDPGREGKRQSLVDLTRKGGSPLKNVTEQDMDVDESNASFKSLGVAEQPTMRKEDAVLDSKDSSSHPPKSKTSSCQKTARQDGMSRMEEPPGKKSPKGGLSGFNDRGSKTIVGRQETCIVNAAYLANSWGGPKRFNKPIVVDIELPVWQDGEEADEVV